MKWDWLPTHDATTRDILRVVRPGISDATVYSLDQACVLYIFRGSLDVSGRIQIQGYSSDLFQPVHLYARTAKNLWKLDLHAWLKPGLFEQAHDSALVNMRQLPVLITDRLEQRWYQFTFPDQHVEAVPISRRCYARARRAYRQLFHDIISERSNSSARTGPFATQDASPDPTRVEPSPSQYEHEHGERHTIRHKPDDYRLISTGSPCSLDATDRGVHDAQHQKARAPIRGKAGGS